MALLSLIPFKDWVYGAIIASLLVAFGVYTHHERVLGEQKIVAIDAKAAAAAEAKVKAATDAAQLTEIHNAVVYKQIISSPLVADTGLVCKRAAAPGSTVPPAGSGSGAAAGSPVADSGSGSAFDPSGAILTRGRDADAQISYLQNRVKELEGQMEHGP